jgi:hypothetical protein
LKRNLFDRKAGDEKYNPYFCKNSDCSVKK